MFNWYESQTRRSPLAFHGSTLAHSAGQDLRIFDALTMKRVGGYALSHLHFCFVQDGTLVVVAQPKDSPTCLVHRIDGNGIRETITGPVFAAARRYPTHVLAAGSSDEIFVTEDASLVAFRLVRGQIETTARISIAFPGSSRRGQMFSLGDGRLVIFDEALRVVQPGKPEQRSEMGERSPLHLVPASADRLWYSHPTTKELRAANELVLARIATPLVEDHRIDFAPGRIVHLASGAGVVAALVFSFHEGTSPTKPDLRWVVVVIAENGTERWRAEVPSTFTPTLLALNQVGFLAVSAQRVVLVGEAAAMLVWDAATGAAIDVP
jgi:hypothetical protein